MVESGFLDPKMTDQDQPEMKEEKVTEEVREAQSDKDQTDK